MQLFYNGDLTAKSARCDFDKTESRHLQKVLRKTEGDTLDVTNGRGLCFRIELDVLEKYKVSGKILNFEQQDKKNYHLHMAVCPTKNKSRFENFLEKATEIGVDEITPIYAENSERKSVKHERCLRVIEAAMKQSLRWTLPKLNAASSFNDFIKKTQADQKFIAHCEKTDRKSLVKEIEPQQSTLITIGPEGDFTPEEIKSALSQNYRPVILGPNRLRTETAAIVSCHTAVLKNDAQE